MVVQYDGVVFLTKSKIRVFNGIFSSLLKKGELKDLVDPEAGSYANEK
jgi:hypothetical protein